MVDKIKTRDPKVFIIVKEPSRVVYEHPTLGTWEITGDCNQCGLCEVGGNDSDIVWNEGIPVGEPGACYNVLGDARLDNPCLPNINEMFPGCTLSGRWLNGN